MAIIPSNLIAHVRPQALPELEGAATSLAAALKIVDSAPAMQNASPGTKQLSFAAMNELTQQLDDAQAYGGRFLAEAADPRITDVAVAEVAELGELLGAVRGAGLVTSITAHGTPVQQMLTPIHELITIQFDHTARVWRSAADDALEGARQSAN